jgi:nucleotide-binding universal stress UspA family protein
MRIVVGLDGSAPSLIAQQLVVSISWPAGTQFVFVTAHGGHEHEWAAELDRLAEPLRRAGHVVEVLVEAGQPGQLLREVANEGAADLVVVGSRGHGTAASALLGSVSAELADHCVCPVLVARTPQVTRALVAADGSRSANAIPHILAHWGILRGVPFDVISVASRSAASTDFLITAWAPSAPVGEAWTADDDTVRHLQYAEGMVEQLAAAGIRASALVSHGDAARELVAGAAQLHSDLIITGSRGLGDLQRMITGSVAHNVLLHSHCSVLIMRGQVPARISEPVAVAARSLSLS